MKKRMSFEQASRSAQAGAGGKTRLLEYEAAEFEVEAWIARHLLVPFAQATAPAFRFYLLSFVPSTPARSSSIASSDRSDPSSALFAAATDSADRTR